MHQIIAQNFICQTFDGSIEFSVNVCKLGNFSHHNVNVWNRIVLRCDESVWVVSTTLHTVNGKHVVPHPTVQRWYGAQTHLSQHGKTQQCLVDKGVNKQDRMKRHDIKRIQKSLAAVSSYCCFSYSTDLISFSTLLVFDRMCFFNNIAHNWSHHI